MKKIILGIDEVGRGCWAGPLVVGAVVLGEANIAGLDDSKNLSKIKRETLAKEIFKKASAVGLGWVSAAEIDRIGLSLALKKATRLAVEDIKAPYHEIIIDGTINFLAGTSKGGFAKTLKKADALISEVSAASIVAKVSRDNFMKEQSMVFTNYNFENNVGYGTKKHIEAIEKFGVCELHRLSISPLQKYKKQLTDEPLKDKIFKKTSKQLGNLAEDLATEYLVNKGHQILARNWRTNNFEIDIVSRNNNKVYFVEVKYRKSQDFGGGLAKIDNHKINHMKCAIEAFTSVDNTGCDIGILVIDMCGSYPKINKIIDLV